MKILFCLMAILCLSFNSIGQSTSSNLHPLKIGDTVPDIAFINVLNYSSSNTRLSQFNNKIILLDFWSSWCGNCISLFPHLDSLQKQFGDQLQIILFNTHSRNSQDDAIKINKLFKNLEQRTGFINHLPVVYDCDSLDNYFPNKYIPHEVWLSGDKKVLAITSHLEVTAGNIQSLLSGQTVALHNKEDILDYEKDKPLFTNNNGHDGDVFIARSILTGYKDGMHGSLIRTSVDNPGKVTGATYLNVQLPFMVYEAYSDQKKMAVPLNRKIVMIADTALWIDRMDSSLYDYSFCYDITSPPVTQAQLRQYIREDLYRYFHIHVLSVIKKLPCYILKKAGDRKIAFAKGRVQETIYEPEDINKHLSNLPAREVMKFFDLRLQYPLFDESGISADTALDIQLPDALTNQKGLLAALRQAGFDITIEQRVMAVTVITDKK